MYIVFILLEQKMFSISLREHAADVINFEKKKMIPLKEKELKSHQDTTQCFICIKKFTPKFTEEINHQKVRNHCPFTGKQRGVLHL